MALGHSDDRGSASTSTIGKPRRGAAISSSTRRGTPLETEIENHLLTRCRQAGILCLKFTSPARAGVPDRVVIAPAGTVFVEVKRPGGKLRQLQQVTIDKMRAAGAEVYVVDTVEGVEELIVRLEERKTAA